MTELLGPVLELQGVSKHFGAVTALEQVSLSIPRGELTAIVGDNGAGKSTLMKIVSGLYELSEGQIFIGGEPAPMTGPEDARALGIEVVYQDLALVEQQPVFMNVFLGRELTRGPFGVLDRQEMRSQSEQLLSELRIGIPSVDLTVDDLSGGQRQGVAIGRAVKWAKHMILLDEPTAALGVAESARVEEVIAGLRESGVSIVLVSHDMSQVFRLADSIVVLRRGRVAGHLRKDETSIDEIVGLITGSTALFPGE